MNHAADPWIPSPSCSPLYHAMDTWLRRLNLEVIIEERDVDCTAYRSTAMDPLAQIMGMPHSDCLLTEAGIMFHAEGSESEVRRKSLRCSGGIRATAQDGKASGSQPQGGDAECQTWV